MSKREIYIVIEKDEDGFYIGEAPQLRGCYSQGSTIDELLKNMQEVIELCLEDEPSGTNLNEFIGVQMVAIE